MPRANQNPADTATALSAARNAARRAAVDLARDAGAPTIARPLFPGASTTTQDVEPQAGMRAAREIELGARYAALATSAPPARLGKAGTRSALGSA